jgi:hypothetical protein
MVKNSHQRQQSEQSPLNSDGQQFTPISTKQRITSKQWWSIILEVIVHFVDIGVNCWPSLVRGDCLLCWYWWNCWPSLVLEMCVRFVDIGVNCWPSLFRGGCLLCWYWWNYWPSLFRGDSLLCWYWCELFTITVYRRLFALLTLVWIFDHHCLEVVVCFVDIGVNCWPSLTRRTVTSK